MHQKNMTFVTIGILKILVLSMSHYLCNGSRDLMQKVMSFNDVVVYVKGSAYILVYEQR